MTFAARSAAALLLLAAMPAEAQRGCATIRALTNADGRDFANLRIGLGPGDGVVLRAGTARPDFPAAESCEVVSAGYPHKDLSCQWRFFDEAAATAFFEPLLARMEGCLADGLPQAEIITQTPGWRILRRHETLIGAPYSQTRVELALVDARRDDAAIEPRGHHLVTLTVEYEQGD